VIRNDQNGIFVHAHGNSDPEGTHGSDVWERFKLMYLVLTLIVVFILVWDLAWWLTGVKPLFPARLKENLNPEQGDPPLLVDVRTGFEYKFFRIEGSKNYPSLLYNPEQLPADDLDKPVVIICMSGHRSAVAAYLLNKRGFKNVSYLVWGMLAWIGSGGPVVSGTEEQ